jgi:hypothetical protein
MSFFGTANRRLAHKPGCDSGVDYAAVIVYLLWIIATIVLIILFAVKGHGKDEPQPLWLRAATPASACIAQGAQHAISRKGA